MTGHPNAALLLLLGLPLLSLILFRWSLRFAERSSRSRFAGIVLANVFLLGVLAGIVLVGSELYYRFIYDRSDGFALGLTSAQWIERHYERNNFGIRDDVDYRNEIDPAKTRVTFLGDSYTNAHGVADVSDRFVNLIRRRHPEWEVHFLGDDGKETGDLIEILDARLAEGYEVERVVYLYCLNDLSDLDPGIARLFAQLYAHAPGFPFDSSFVLNTWYYRYRIRSGTEAGAYFDLLKQGYRGAPWEQQAVRLETLKNRVRKAGGEFAVVTFPFFETLEEPGYREIHDQLDAFWAGQDVPYLDLREAFEGIPFESLIAHGRDTHPGPEAHRIAAERIERFLSRVSRKAQL